MPQYSVWPPKSNFEIQRHQCMPLPPLPGQHDQRILPAARPHPPSSDSVRQVSAPTPSLGYGDVCPAGDILSICHQSALYPDFLSSLSYSLPRQEALGPIIEQDSLSIYSGYSADYLDASKSNRQSLLPPPPEHPLIYKPAAAIERVECRLSADSNQDDPVRPSPKPGPTTNLLDNCTNQTLAASPVTGSPRVPSLTHSLSVESIIGPSLSSCRLSTDTVLVGMNSPTAPRKADKSRPKVLSPPNIRNTSAPNSSPPAISSNFNSDISFTRTLATSVDVRYQPSRPAPATPRLHQDRSFFWDDDDDDDGDGNLQCQPMRLRFKRSIPDFKVRKGSKGDGRTSLAHRNANNSRLSPPVTLTKPIPVAKANRNTNTSRLSPPMTLTKPLPIPKNAVAPAPPPKLNPSANDKPSLSRRAMHQPLSRSHSSGKPYRMHSLTDKRGCADMTAVHNPSSPMPPRSKSLVEEPLARDQDTGITEFTTSTKVQTKGGARVQWLIGKVLRR